MTITEEIQARLLDLRDETYAEFQRKIVPDTKYEIIGVRTPELRGLAKELAKREDISSFLRALPHRYFDENQLHAFIVSLIKDFDRAMEETELLLPYIDSWATCDQMSPKCFKKRPEELLEHIRVWIRSDKTYTVRFGIGMLMEHFLGDSFRAEYADLVCCVRSEEYYVNMMRAWYFATALAKNREEIMPYLKSRRLDTWTHNKAIQKAVESYRISAEDKEYLKTLKIR